MSTRRRSGASGIVALSRGRDIEDSVRIEGDRRGSGNARSGPGMPSGSTGSPSNFHNPSRHLTRIGPGRPDESHRACGGWRESESPARRGATRSPPSCAGAKHPSAPAAQEVLHSRKRDRRSPRPAAMPPASRFPGRIAGAVPRRTRTPSEKAATHSPRWRISLVGRRLARSFRVGRPGAEPDRVAVGNARCGRHPDSISARIARKVPHVEGWKPAGIDPCLARKAQFEAVLSLDLEREPLCGADHERVGPDHDPLDPVPRRSAAATLVYGSQDSLAGSKIEMPGRDRAEPDLPIRRDHDGTQRIARETVARPVVDPSSPPLRGRRRRRRLPKRSRYGRRRRPGIEDRSRSGRSSSVERGPGTPMERRGAISPARRPRIPSDRFTGSPSGA